MDVNSVVIEYISDRTGCFVVVCDMPRWADPPITADLGVFSFGNLSFHKGLNVNKAGFAHKASLLNREFAARAGTHEEFL